MIDVDFSFATHNRTGKFFIGRDLIQDNVAKIDRLLYWRASTSPVVPPLSGIAAKITGRLAKWESIARQRSALFDRTVPKIRSDKPVLHLDPYSTICHVLAPYDFVVCHDVGPLTHPDLFPSEVTKVYSKVYSDIARAKPNMIYMSIATQNEFRRLFPGPMESERVIYPPLRSDMASSGMEPLDIREKFLLTVGSIGLRKNNLRAIRAYEQSGMVDRNISFVMCGGREPGYEEVAAAAAITKGVKLLDYVSDMQLNWLYRTAIGFVLPSLLEGFGMPVAEAAAVGLIPLVSANSVLHEVAGEGAVFADPYDVEDISKAILRLVDMGDDERTLRKRMLELSMARFTRDVFKEAWAKALH